MAQRYVMVFAMALALGACATAGRSPLPEEEEQGFNERADAGGSSEEETEKIDARQATDAGRLSSTTDASIAGGPDAAPAGCSSPSYTNLLDNGNFDGAGGWTESTLGGVSIINSDGTVIVPHSAPSFAWFGGYHDAVDKLSQTVSVPSGTTSLRLSGHYCIETEETGAYDSMVLDLRMGTTTVLETIASATSEGGPATCDNIDQVFEFPAGDAHAGETVTLVLDAQTDGSLITNFFLDSLKLEALACP